MSDKETVRIDAPVLVLMGPTAVGKTDLSFRLAERYDCEIVSVDSMQVYRYMDIGTAKPSREEQEKFPHHLIDIVTPDEQFDSALFVSCALTAVTDIVDRGKVPLLTGGTGMYLKALFHGLFDMDRVTDPGVRQGITERLAEQGREALHRQLGKIDPASAARIHPNDTQRLVRALEIVEVTGKTWSELLREQGEPPVSFSRILQIGLACERTLLYDRITRRSHSMMEQGLIREVEELRDMGYTSELSSMQAIGYRHASMFLDGEWSKDETIRLLIRDTRRYAKRQLTWFNNSSEIQWVDRESPDEIVAMTDAWINE